MVDKGDEDIAEAENAQGHAEACRVAG
jgi:hypothetical protein